MVRRVSLWLIHLSFVAVLVGAIVSALERATGYMEMKPGETTDIFIQYNQLTHSLPAAVRLDSVAVSRDSGSEGVKNYTCFLTVFPTPDGESISFGISTRDGLRVSLNSPATVGNCRIFVISLYGEGARLGVTIDSRGTIICFIGFILFALGAVMLLFRGGALSCSLLSIILAVSVLLAVMMREGLVFGQLPPILQSGWLPLHVSLVAAAYLIFIIIAITSAKSLIHNKQCSEILAVANRLLLPGVLLLGLGICVGSVWADISWGTYWSWDPKETWALITFVIYSLPIHRKIRFLSHRKTRAVYLILALLAVAMTWFGVNFLDSRHSY